MVNVYISILNFNGKRNTYECIESLKKINTQSISLTILVIDNGSKEELGLKDSEQGNLKIKIIRSERNLGFSGGHNVGIKYALEKGAEFVLILNNDTYVDKNFLKELISAAEKDVKKGILSPKIYFAPGFEFHKDRYRKDELGKVFWYAGGIMDWKNVIGHHRGVDEVDVGQFGKKEEIEYASGCCMLVKKEVFERVGFFDEKYFLYYEDGDLSMRARKGGFKIMYVPTSVVYHKNAGSAGGSGSILQDYYITRNRLFFGFKYASLRAKIALVKESIKTLFLGRPWQKKGVFDFFTSNLGKGSFRV